LQFDAGSSDLNSPSIAMSSHYSLEIDGLEIGSGPKYVEGEEIFLFTPQDRKVLDLGSYKSFLYEISLSTLNARLSDQGFSWVNAKVAFENLINETIEAIERFENLDHMPEDWLNKEGQFKGYLKSLSLSNVLGVLFKCKARGEHAFYPALNSDGLSLEEERLINLLFNRGRFNRINEVFFHPFNLLRLLTGVFPAQKCLTIDYTALVNAGYYEEDSEPIEQGFNEIISQNIQGSLILGETIISEEDLLLENKGISGRNPVQTIKDSLQKYVIGFLNSKGGVIRWGVSDQGIVTGFKLGREDKDRLRRAVGDLCDAVVPNIAGANIQLTFRPIIHDGVEIPDNYCVDIEVPNLESPHIYRIKTKPNRTWVRLDGLTIELQGDALREYARITNKALAEL
jgi:hypothetical protein